MKARPAGTIALALLLQTFLGGCFTERTIDLARGGESTYVDNKTKKEITTVKKPQPAAYALLPFAVVGDIASLPFWVGACIPVWLGLEPPQM